MFSGCTSLRSVVIPDSVTSIDDKAFSGCTSLRSIVIPDSVTDIGRDTFFGCTSLKSIVIPDSVTNIGEYAFSGCTSLKSAAIPNSVTVINEGMFSDCTSLGSVVIPASVTSMGNAAFSRCTSLQSVLIPASVTSIDYYAFSGCDSLTAIYGYRGTYAEKFADSKQITFIPLNDIPDAQTLIDKATDIRVTTDSATVLSVVPVEPKSVEIEISETIAAAYDITLFRDGVAVRPDNTVTVRIPTDYETARVYRLEDDGTLTDMNAVYADGYLVFTTEHFSLYLVTGPFEAPTNVIFVGDVDSDGEVEVRDATWIQRVIAGMELPFAFDMQRADIDGDGDITIMDASFIQKWLAGMNLTLPSGRQIGSTPEQSAPKNEDFSYLDNKPVCASCGSENVAYIIYGMPLSDEYYSEAFKEKLDNGEILFGGCVISDPCPSWHCNNCGYEF